MSANKTYQFVLNRIISSNMSAIRFTPGYAASFNETEFLFLYEQLNMGLTFVAVWPVSFSTDP